MPIASSPARIHGALPWRICPSLGWNWVRVVLEERGTTTGRRGFKRGREDIVALSLGLSLEHRTHTRKLEPDLFQEAMQLTLARVGWVCWETRTEMSSATLCVYTQPTSVGANPTSNANVGGVSRAALWQHSCFALWPRTVRAQACWENNAVRVVSRITDCDQRLTALDSELQR